MLIPEEIDEAPASAKLVYAALQVSEDALTADELQRRTRLPRSTTHDALAELEEQGVVEAHPSWHDGRQTFYTVPFEALPPDSSEIRT